MIIPFFVPYQGCPNRCIYCNVRKIAGKNVEVITEDTFREKVHRYLDHPKKKPDSTEIAFYGGNFTGMAEDDQTRLLEFAAPFIQKRLVQAIRISTRPDYIDDEHLRLLRDFGVTIVEVGAQSMVDYVLDRSNRGHSASDVSRAVAILKEKGFKTGIHLMAGLPEDSRDGFEHTIRETVALKPHMVRIHPTLVLADTGLEELFVNGAYRPLSMTEAIDLCKYAVRMFEEANIPVIRLGLQSTEEMEEAGSVVAGPYHPAFRALVEESMFLDTASAMLARDKNGSGEATFSLSPQDVSFFKGHGNKNILASKKLFNLAKLRVALDPEQERGTIVLTARGGRRIVERRH